MGQIGLTSARALEGNTPIGGAHGRPPDLPNSQEHGSIVWELAFVGSKARVRVHKARRPVLDERACTHPDPWPSLGIITIDPDIYLGSALQLEGEQNFHIPCVGSELHAAPSAPQIFSSPSPLPPVLSPSDTLTRENLSRGEGAAPSGAPPKAFVLGPRSHRARVKKTRKQGECHQYRATHLRSPKTLTFSDLMAWPRTRT